MLEDSEKLDIEHTEKPDSKPKKRIGRPPGSKNKKTILAERRQSDNIGEGQLPLEYMLAVMRDIGENPGRRDDMAKAAAPYVHPKFTAVDHVTGKTEPVKVSIDGVDAKLL